MNEGPWALHLQKGKPSQSSRNAQGLHGLGCASTGSNFYLVLCPWILRLRSHYHKILKVKVYINSGFAPGNFIQFWVMAYECCRLGMAPGQLCLSLWWPKTNYSAGCSQEVSWGVDLPGTKKRIVNEWCLRARFILIWRYEEMQKIKLLLDVYMNPEAAKCLYSHLTEFSVSVTQWRSISSLLELAVGLFL